MNKYSLTASILSFILAVSALPAGAAANEVRPRAALDSVETTVIEEPAENEETGDAEEIEYSVVDSVETADSESEETLEAADSEPEDTMTPEVSGSEEDTDAGEEPGAAVTHEVRLPSGQEGILIRSSGSTRVSPMDSFTFYLAPAKGWQKGKNFSVKAGETVLKPVPVKTADTEKTGSGNPEDKDSTPSSESGEPASVTEDDSAVDAGDDAPVDKEENSGSSNSSSPQESLEKRLAAQGYEKYVIKEVTGDITVSVTGVEKIAATETKEAEEDREDKEAEDKQEPAPESEENSEQEIPEEQTLADEYADGEVDHTDDPRAYAGDVFEGGNFISDDHEDIVPGTDESGLSEMEEEIVPGQDQEYTDAAEGQWDSPTDLEEAEAAEAAAETQNVIPGQDDGSLVPGAVEEAAAAGEPEDGTASVPEDGAGADQSTGDMSDETVSDSPAFAGTTAESGDGGNQAAVVPQPTDTAGQSTPAAAVDEYPLWVGGIRATKANCKDMAGDGTIAYDDEKKILTLKYASVKDRKETVAPIYYNGDKPLKIVFSGDCSITDSKAGSGIVCESSSLILDGTGSLTVRTAAPLSGACIQADKGELIISGGTVTAVSSDIGPGLSASKITIGNDVVRVEAGSAEKAVSAGNEIEIGSLLWITTPSGGKISDDKKTITTDAGKTADKAVIESRPVYEVTFDPGEGSGTMDPKHVVMGQKLELPECSFTAPQCKAFSGWKIGTQIYKAGDSVTVKKSFTATAQWKDAHSLTKIAKKNPTCLEKGRKEHYKCKVCGKCFSDSAASKPIKESDTIIPALGHKWGDPTYTWAKDYSTVTAKRVCERDKTHIESEKVKTTKKGTDPTCTKEGKYTYTAVFSNKAFEKQVKNVRKAALGHNWGIHDFIWTQNDDGSYDCECRFTCTRDSSHKKTVDCDVKESLTLPTKSADGRLYYTAKAELNDKEYTDTLEDYISPAGNSGYRFTKATDTWKHGSGKDLDFTVKRYEYDMITYRAFSHILVDGKSVSNAYYDTWEGSLKLEIDDRYLNILDTGSHTLTVEFKDGSVSRSFTVKDASSKGAPSTGDNSSSLLWILSIVSCAAVIAALLTLKMKKK